MVVDPSCSTCNNQIHYNGGRAGGVRKGVENIPLEA